MSRSKKEPLTSRPRKNVRGLWADLPVDLSEAALAEDRKEAWGSFPRYDEDDQRDLAEARAALDEPGSKPWSQVKRERGL